jgi:hypothetical protein
MRHAVIAAGFLREARAAAHRADWGPAGPGRPRGGPEAGRPLVPHGCCRSKNRCTLPLGVFGSWSTKVMARG